MSDFICPVNTPRLTSKYGMRTHPVKRIRQLHGGVDLVNNKGGKVPIYASADGTVRLVKNTKTGYGKYVIITHKIKGVTYETNYAHLDSYSVKVGQKVKQGEQIGIMGTTGTSTGVHLHFEIHRGTYNYGGGSYPNSRDPMQYINLNDTPDKLKNQGKNNKVEKDEDELKFTSATLKKMYQDRIESEATMKLLDDLAVKELKHKSKLKNGKLSDGDLVAIALELAVHLAKEQKK